MRISDWSSDVCSSDLVRLTPKGIRTHLGLNRPIYRQTAASGHFGRQANGDAFPWERTDLTDKLKAAFPLQFSRSDEHTSELQSLLRISYAVFCLNKKTSNIHNQDTTIA